MSILGLIPDAFALVGCATSDRTGTATGMSPTQSGFIPIYDLQGMGDFSPTPGRTVTFSAGDDGD
jgi:hypothetical protein